ncbi:MAG: hypothetical protein JOZ00_00235 [Mycobacterium sp.]|uniref:hypothetical protein n=1 Tax=Mycobacterium sp. TaxID=1785 RepID=UPI001EB4BF94|nr:hypothetical protein [Mycobacterium sp.]MBV8785099.1 hypothetical protein [Mycobacterium sp.]
MDVVLGVAVTGPVARLALLDPGGRGAGVIDQSVVDLEDNPVGKLTETVVGTNRLLADENHRLVGTRVCWPDDSRAAQLQQSLQQSGVSNVAVLSESQAVAALMRAAGRPGAALVMDDATSTLSLIGPAAGDPEAPPTMLAQAPLAGSSGADATAALDTMLANLTARPDAPGDVYLVGASPALNQVADRFRDASTMRVEVADDPTFAVARGAAIAAAPGALGDATAMAPAIGLTGDATAMAPAVGLTGDETTVVPTSEFAGPDAEENQLAYSMADEPELDEYGPEFDEYDDYDEEFDEAEPTKLSRRSLLIGNAVIAFAVIGLASLATAIAVAVRPTASQQPVVGVQNGTPGKFMPILPTQQQAPLPPPPVDQPNAGFQGGTVPAPSDGGAVPQPVQPPAGGGAPVGPVPAPLPGGPGGPGYVPGGPGPIVPMPIPVPIPFPGWHPNYPPYNPPYNPPYTPPTTTYSPPTTTHEPPTTTHEPPTTTYSPPTTQEAPTTPHEPPTTHEAPTNTYTPPTHTQQTVPPTHSQQPVFPQEPHGGGGHHGF